MDYRRPESPPPRRSSGRTGRRAYSPSPEPPRYAARPSGRPRRAETYRAPSPPPATKEAPRRPDLSRSKTTSTKPKGFAGLSPRWQKAATAALQAGGAAAYSMRSDPGAWKGDKGLRVATAALGAGAFDAFNKSGKPDGGSKSSGKKRSDIEALGGTLGGLILDQIASRAGNGKKH
ncbi:hypothetical protein GQ53DRAFT_826788 [Thozetella sp. PMI_491]|nr:hypothetical protein GQ53DRAFT_826788 [Thozetella sp. PMI_491]